MMNTNPPTEIVILGAGYAGLMAALRLAGRTRGLNARLTLVNASPDFVQRPRLHHVAVGQDPPRTPLRHLLRGTRIRLIRGWVTGLDLAAREVHVRTEAGQQGLPYDHLVYALGSQVDRSAVPGVREHAYALDPAGPRSAPALRERLAGLDGTGGRLVVVGGGATGIEVAAEIKGAYPTLEVAILTAGAFGIFKGPRVERHFRDSFRRQGIEIIENQRVTAVHQDSVELKGGARIPADITVWAGGFRAPALAEEAGFKVNRRGQILVDPFGRALSHPEVYAVGDSSHPVEAPGNPMRMSLFTALIRGAHAADNLSADLKGARQEPLSFAYYGQGIAMGPDDAVGFLGYPADRPVGPILRGRLAVYVRDFFVWMIYFFLVIERRFPGFFFWLGKNRYRKAIAREGGRKTAETSP
jgi:NADH dehydrogenase FAD-containing subunit